MAKHNELGEIGERIAVDHLIKKGFRILDRNWHFGKEEIDIIAEKDGYVIFVEVKTRESAWFETASNTVGTTKQKKIIHVADHYYKEKDLANESRFDIIFIIHNSKYTKIDHIENAFYPTV